MCSKAVIKYISFSELPTEVKKPLKDLTVKEKDQIILKCELTRPNKAVKWFKDHKELKPSDHIHYSVDMFTHQLVVDDVNLNDSGVYKLVFGDVSTEAKISVEGMFFVLNRQVFRLERLNLQRFQTQNVCLFDLHWMLYLKGLG